MYGSSVATGQLNNVLVGSRQFMTCLGPTLVNSLHVLTIYGGSIATGQFNDVLVDSRQFNDVMVGSRQFNDVLRSHGILWFL